MRARSPFKGLRSLFSRAARRVKAFFGWGAEDKEHVFLARLPEQEQEPPQCEQERKKTGDDDGSDSGGDGMPSHHRRIDGETEDVHADEEPCIVNYATGEKMPVEQYQAMWRRKEAERLREQRVEREQKQAVRQREANAERTRKVTRTRQTAQYAVQKQAKAEKAQASRQQRTTVEQRLKAIAAEYDEQTPKTADEGLSL